MHPSLTVALALLSGWMLTSPALGRDSDIPLEMSLEELLDIEVTSVSKRPQSLSDTAAAIHVISNDDIRHSGVTNIPDALRMAPGIQVVRIDSNKWAVTSRGFNGRFANKLLVLIDGRTIYSPTFSGVYWEVNDLVLEDVERIEVIRGPGATVWGANAVNGVINIITKHTADTQGSHLSLASGSQERGLLNARYGTRLGEGSYGRLSLKAFTRDESNLVDGGHANDQWRGFSAGFRLDSQLGPADSLTVQGDINHRTIDQFQQIPLLTIPFQDRVKNEAELDGMNLLARWTHSESADSVWTAQVYLDRFERDEYILGERRNTLDLDINHNFKLSGGHEIGWGLGYRYTDDDFESTPFVFASPDDRDADLFSAFIQDQISLVPDTLDITLGSKFENNDYSGFEFQPSIRATLHLNEGNMLWAAVSRAVRTPSRAEHDFTLLTAVLPPGGPVNPYPIAVSVFGQGSDDFGSEKVVAYELGYRGAPFNDLTLDLATFYNEYSDLRAFAFGIPQLANPPAPARLDTRFSNETSGRTYGLELAATWQASNDLRLDLSYSYTETDIDWPNVPDITQNTSAPRNLVSLRSRWRISEDLNADAWLRYTDEIETYHTTEPPYLFKIKAFTELDLRLAWQANKQLELSLVGQNLLHGHHQEYVQEAYILPTEVERSFYVQAALSF
ncbi:MAG: TonB-dependent receptor [Chromatiales bacterium]|nr:TonB-dependent receptor [Chromatiales bacterium]